MAIKFIFLGDLKEQIKLIEFPEDFSILDQTTYSEIMKIYENFCDPDILENNKELSNKVVRDNMIYYFRISIDSIFYLICSDYAMIDAVASSTLEELTIVYKNKIKERNGNGYNDIKKMYERINSEILSPTVQDATSIHAEDIKLEVNGAVQNPTQGESLQKVTIIENKKYRNQGPPRTCWTRFKWVFISFIIVAALLLVILVPIGINEYRKNNSADGLDDN
jgi:hypothetical protein